jgi:hypothetical protein
LLEKDPLGLTGDGNSGFEGEGIYGYLPEVSLEPFEEDGVDEV